jgi:hypothetical protein
MNIDYFKKGCKELIRELTRLVDKGKYMSRDEFHEICKDHSFLDNLIKKYPDIVILEYFNPNSTLFNKENYNYFNESLGSHANAVVMEDYGLEKNALLLAVNLCISILYEII